MIKWEDDDPEVGVRQDVPPREVGRRVATDVNEDGYRAGGTWYGGNWLSKWGHTADMVGHGENGSSWSRNTHGITNPNHAVTSMSQARLRQNYCNINIIGFKGVPSCRKRKVVGMSGGWLAGGQKPGRSQWRHPGRRNGKDNINSTVHQVDGNIQVDRGDTVQGMQAMVLEGVMVSEQMKVLPVITVNSAVLCQKEIDSDKDNKLCSDYWAQECMFTGAAGHGEGLHHHQHADEEQEPQVGPGHVVQDDIGHMEDKPGKDKQQCLSNISVAGLAVQGDAAGVQGEGGGGGGQHDGDSAEEGGDGLLLQHVHGELQGQGIHQRGGVCAARQDGGHGCADGQGVQGEVSGGLVQHDRGGGRGVRDEGRGGVHAQVKDGFGGQKVKRSYWRKRVVPDGLVQSRINHFSAMVPRFGGGEGVATILPGIMGCRKRKFSVDQETSAADLQNLRWTRQQPGD